MLFPCCYTSHSSGEIQVCCSQEQNILSLEKLKILNHQVVVITHHIIINTLNQFSYFPFCFPSSLPTYSLTAVLTNLFRLQTCLISKLMHDPHAQKLRNHSERCPREGCRISGRNGNVVEIEVMFRCVSCCSTVHVKQWNKQLKYFDCSCDSLFGFVYS